MTTLIIPGDLFDPARPPHENQRAAVEYAAAARLVVVTGGPGVGKTFTVNAIRRLFTANGLSVAQAAPTGKAAVRMTEQTGAEATTLHRLLGWTPTGWRFDASRPVAFDADGVPVEGPLPYDAVIIDECSMVDIELFQGLMEALDTRRTRLVLVGDVNQLPSIGPGRVLHDMIQSGVVPVAELTHIFRQAEESRIPYVARDINAGTCPDVSQMNPKTHGGDVAWVSIDDVDALRETLVEMVCVTIPDRKGIPAEDVQVLVPQHRKGLGDEDLNPLLQQRLNPNYDAHERAGLKVGRGYRLFRGDRILHANKNNYQLEVANGETGRVLEADWRGIDYDDDVVVSIPGRKVVAVIDFGNRKVGYTQIEAQDHLELAYAMTVHKSQGSQFRAVVMPVHGLNGFMLTRPLVYTGVTRAEQFLVLMGEESALAKAAGNTRGVKRRTGLQECVRECAAQ